MTKIYKELSHLDMYCLQCLYVCIIRSSNLNVRAASKYERWQRSGIGTIKYNTCPRIPHGKVAKTQLNINESQEVSPFPAGDHKAAMKRRKSMKNTRQTLKLFFKVILECTRMYCTMFLRLQNRHFMMEVN